MGEGGGAAPHRRGRRWPVSAMSRRASAWGSRTCISIYLCMYSRIYVRMAMLRQGGLEGTSFFLFHTPFRDQPQGQSTAYPQPPPTTHRQLLPTTNNNPPQTVFNHQAMTVHSCHSPMDTHQVSFLRDSMVLGCVRRGGGGKGHKGPFFL